MCIAKLDAVAAQLLLFVIWLVSKLENEGRKDQNRERKAVCIVTG